MDLEQVFTDVAQVNSFNSDYVLYIYSFRRGDNMYSFVTDGVSNGFVFYYITGAEDEGT